ncbi:MAG: hypothetical protein WCL51_02715 [Bacteroidota bacterium]
MKKITLLTTIIGFIILIAFCTSCTRTKPLSEIPTFNISNDSLQLTLNSIITAEHINICGYEKKSLSSTTIFLQIDILNGNNIPSGNNEQQVLSKKIASFFKHALKNQNAYAEYRIKYAKKLKDNSLVTLNSYQSFKFKSDEL